MLIALSSEVGEQSFKENCFCVFVFYEVFSQKQVIFNLGWVQEYFIHGQNGSIVTYLLPTNEVFPVV